MEAIAPTLAYDHAAILGKDASVPTGQAARVAVPTLVVHGDASYPFTGQTARALTQAIPHAQLRTLAGQDHNVSPAVLAAVLVQFFTP
jgi:pimeloyl-ACP methyl ester carboxylesterase